MDKDSFRQKFTPTKKSGIRIIFNWSRFINDTAIVLQSVPLDPADFNKLYAPWYLDENDHWTNYCSFQARPVSIAVAACMKDVSGKENYGPDWNCIDKYEKCINSYEIKNISNSFGPIPAVALPDNCYLILDGNHRLTALSRVSISKPVRIELVVIGGVVGPCLVPDLSHWLKL